MSQRLRTLIIGVIILGLLTTLLVQSLRAGRREAALQARLQAVEKERDVALVAVEEIDALRRQEMADVVFVRQYSGDRRSWNRGHAFRVRLDIDRLRAYDLSKEDVVRALTPSGIVDPKRVDPPPGVVPMWHYLRPDQYENIILKASPGGEVVRLNEVAKVEVGW